MKKVKTKGGEDMKRCFCVLLCTVLLLTALVGCRAPVREPEVQNEVYYEYFGTVSAVFSYAGDAPEEFGERCERIRRRLEYYHRLFDIYYEYSGVTNLCTVNKNAGKGPLKVDAALIDFLLYAKEMHTLTNGKMNIAMGAPLKLWHDCRESAEGGEGELPDEEALSEAYLHTDIDDIVLDREASTVQITDTALRIDVGALGKGYAVEMITGELRSEGLDAYVLNIGGNISAIGRKTTGEGWLTGITNPDRSSSESFACRITIADTSLVTSGNYERFYTVGGVRYHHIIDPLTRLPAAYFASVSILTRDSALADALSTALFCMSEADGRALVATLGGVEVLWIYEDGRLSMTDGFSALLVE